MANYIDSLMLSIGLDASQFKKGSGEAETALKKMRESGVKTGKQVEESGNKAAEAIAGVTRQALTLFAVFMGGKGLKAFTEDLMRSDSALGRFADRLGVAPQAISEYSQAIGRMGGNGQAAAQSMQSLTDSLIDLQQTGSSSITEWYYRLSAASGVVFDRNKSVQQQFLDISEALHRLSASNPALANWYGKKLGLDQDTVDFLRHGPGYVQNQLQRGSRWAPTPEEIKRLADLQDSWRDLENIATEYGRIMVTSVSPAVSDAFRTIENYLSTNKDAIKNSLAGPFRDMAEAIRSVDWESFVKGISKVFDFVDRLYHLLKSINDDSKDWWITKLLNSTAGGDVGGGLDSLPDEAHDKSLGHVDSWVGNKWRRFKKWMGDRFVPSSPDTSDSSTPSSDNYGWGAPGTYRPGYALSDADLSDAVVNTIAGEAQNNQTSTDAVINTMFNRLGTTAYGPSGNLRDVARAPGQFAGYSRASAARAAYIRGRLRAIASGAVPDNTNGANEFRAGSYSGPWAQNHPGAPVIGGNRFAYNPRSGKGPYAAYNHPHDPYSPPLMGFGSRAISPHGLVGLRGAAAAKGSNDNRVTNHSSAQVNVNGPITVQAGGDADKIANELHAAIQRSAYANMANYGLA